MTEKTNRFAGRFVSFPGIGTRGMVNNHELLNMIKTRVQDATWVMSVCTGAGVLASTGEIDGYNATYVEIV